MCQALILPFLDVGKGRKTITVAPGATVADMVAAAFPSLPEHRGVRVLIGEHVIPQERWRVVRPRYGTTVVIRLVPAGNDNLRSILTVAVLVAATITGQYYAGPAIAGALEITGIGYTLITTATTAAFAVAGTLLINAFIPQQGLGDQGGGTSLSAITGLQNQSNPGGVIPSILGLHRYAPVYAAPAYTEIIGDDLYVIVAFLFGHGPLNFTKHQLGDTSIDGFSDVQMEVRQGLPGDAPLELYPQQVLEEQLSVELRNADGPSVRFTARDVTEVSLDFSFPQGLVYIDDKGRNQLNNVEFTVRQRKVGVADWTLLPGVTVSAKSRNPLRRSVRWTLPERGQYEIEVRRATQDEDDQTSKISRSDWTAIRSFRPESPFNYDEPLAKVALRIRASKQLNGIVNNYNAVAALVCKDWDTATQTWIERETSNPASLARYVLQGPANVRPKTDDEIDLDALADWHEFCVAKGLTYNRVHDYDASRRDVLADICAAGRATQRDDGTKWTVVIDRPQQTYVSAITPRNSWDFQGSTPYPLFPDGHRVQFIDATNGWNQAERIVPFPGVDPDAVEVTEDLKFPGVTNPDQIWKAARRRQYELIHRPHTYTVSQDFESLVLSRGDMAPLNHDVLDRDHVAARIRSVSGQTIVLDQDVTMVDGRSYAIRIRLSDGSSVRRSVVSAPGDVGSLRLVGDMTGIEEGNLALFGTVVKGPTIDVLVKDVERGDNLTAKLTLVDAAPQIDDLTDADIPPPWDGRVGETVDLSGLIPAVPVVAVSDAFLEFVVTLTPGSGSVVVPATYVVSYRLHGGGSFSTVTVSSTTAVAVIGGFAVGDVIDVKAHAVSAFGQASADSGVVEATLHAATGNAPTFDSSLVKLDSTSPTLDHF